MISKRDRCPSLARLVGALALALAACTDSETESARGEEEIVRELCSTCHLFTPPETLPKDLWSREVEVMYSLLRGSAEGPPPGLPDPARVTAYFTDRAPERLAKLASTRERGSGGLVLEAHALKVTQFEPFPGVSSLRFVALGGSEPLDLLACDMRHGVVFTVRPGVSKESVRLLSRVSNPCFADPVDLDADGERDLLVADLGTVTPSDDLCGKLWWLRGRRSGSGALRYEPRVLLEGVGRVAHAQTGDFDEDGDLDILVAVFGWRRVGSIVLLDHDRDEHGESRFTARTIDPRSGAIHVPVVDLDGDGHLDFVALLAQHHEAVVVYRGDGSGEFTPKEIYRGPHANWGSSGIELVDLDRDGDLDVLCSTGDTLDDLLPKPYHGVAWLENLGALRFAHHPITQLYGCYAAKAGDLDQDGDLDIVACAFLPYLQPSNPETASYESLIWLEQTSPGRFERWSLESGACVHATLDLGDYDADGDLDIAVGNLSMGKTAPGPMIEWYTLWENRTAAKRPRGANR